MKVTAVCDYCGITFTKLAIEMHRHNFCCRQHLNAWNSERIADFNRNENPLNTSAWNTLDRRVARHKMLSGTGEGKTYKKYLGRHEHRVVAERMLGRSLRPGEVVHHIDGNKLNNAQENLRVFPSQSEHFAFHAAMKGGDANEHV